MDLKGSIDNETICLNDYDDDEKSINFPTLSLDINPGSRLVMRKVQFWGEVWDRRVKHIHALQAIKNYFNFPFLSTFIHVQTSNMLKMRKIKTFSSNLTSTAKQEKENGKSIKFLCSKISNTILPLPHYMLFLWKLTTWAFVSGVTHKIDSLSSSLKIEKSWKFHSSILSFIQRWAIKTLLSRPCIKSQVKTHLHSKSHGWREISRKSIGVFRPLWDEERELGLYWYKVLTANWVLRHSKVFDARCPVLASLNSNSNSLT